MDRALFKLKNTFKSVNPTEKRVFIIIFLCKKTHGCEWMIFLKM